LTHRQGSPKFSRVPSGYTSAAPAFIRRHLIEGQSQLRTRYPRSRRRRPLSTWVNYYTGTTGMLSDTRSNFISTCSSSSPRGDRSEALCCRTGQRKVTSAWSDRRRRPRTTRTFLPYFLQRSSRAGPWCARNCVHVEAADVWHAPSGFAPSLSPEPRWSGVLPFLTNMGASSTAEVYGHWEWRDQCDACPCLTRHSSRSTPPTIEVDPQTNNGVSAL
jgi:hypothetical protein